MSDLLSIGRSGVAAYRGALAAVGENVTNSDTVGFARRQVVFTEQTATGAYPLYKTAATFGGVNSSSVKRVWDQYKADDAWTSGSDANRAGTRAQYASSVETMLDDTDVGVGTKLTAVFTSASNLAANPTDLTLRQTMLSALDNAAAAIGQTGANLAKVAGTVQTQTQSLVADTNGALATLAKVNVSLHAVQKGTAAQAQLEDQRDSLITTISGNVGVDVTLDADGAAELRFNDYRGPLLLSARAVSPDLLKFSVALDGRLSTSVLHQDGTTSAALPASGTLAGLVDTSTMIADRRRQIDTMAGDFVTTINTWQGTGNDLNGAPGGALLAGTDAATIKLVATDPKLIAAASTTVGGAPNANLLTLAGLRTNGAEATWRGIVTDQALIVASAKTEATAAASRKDGAMAALDNVTGIDLDNEAAELLRYQQAYSASAKVIQAARDTMQAIFDLF